MHVEPPDLQHVQYCLAKSHAFKSSY